MRIAYIVTCLGVGGAEKVVVGLADSFADRGHEVVIIYLRGAALLNARNPTVKQYALGLESLFTLPLAFFKLRSALKKFQPDVVHSHLVHANILARLVRLTLTFPRLITTAHNRNEEGHFRMLAYRLTDWLADVSTNVSDEATAAFIKQKAVKPGRMITLHNGISTTEFYHCSISARRIRKELELEPTVKLIVAVGRLSEPKDYPNLLAAINKLDLMEVRYLLIIAGDGPLKSELQSLINQFGLVDRVRFLGLRRDIPALLSAADIFVLSSEWEGFPLVVGEAMACECLVVATDCGGVREFVGNAGLLTLPKNSGALAEQLKYALEMTDEERLGYGKAARERITELYSLDAAVHKWLSVYRGVLPNSGTPNLLS